MSKDDDWLLKKLRETPINHGDYVHTWTLPENPDPQCFGNLDYVPDPVSQIVVMKDGKVMDPQPRALSRRERFKGYVNDMELISPGAEVMVRNMVPIHEQIREREEPSYDRRDYGLLITPEGLVDDRPSVLEGFTTPSGGIDVFALSMKAKQLTETMGLPERMLRPDPVPYPFRPISEKTKRTYWQIVGNAMRNILPQHKGGFPRPSVFWSAGWEVVQHKLPPASFEELRVSRAMPRAEVLVLIRPYNRPANLGDGVDQPVKPLDLTDLQD